MVCREGGDITTDTTKSGQADLSFYFYLFIQPFYVIYIHDQ